MTNEPDRIDPAAAQATEEALDRLLASGDPGAHPLGARVSEGLRMEVSAGAAAEHLASLQWNRSGKHHGRRRMLFVIAAAFLVLVIGSTSALAAAQGAQPGDALYGLKRASERLRLAVTGSPQAKAALHLRFAERRFAEIERLIAEHHDPSDLQDDYSRQIEDAADLAELAQEHGVDVDELLAHIEARLQIHVDRLNEVLQNAPEQAQQGLENAIENAQKGHDRARDDRDVNGNPSNGNNGHGRSQTTEPGNSGAHSGGEGHSGSESGGAGQGSHQGGSSGH